ncbi:MAG: hypothetical protein LBG80_15100 [Bacteroidales bacterium]|jgi:hypothetical protein|nr:hypothetical protein [Bacteroidales bacterium]
MNQYVNIENIETMELRDGVIHDTLIITFKDGHKKTIRRFLDGDREVRDLYRKLLKELEQRNNKNIIL